MGQKKPLKSKPVNSSTRKRVPMMMRMIPQKIFLKFMAEIVESGKLRATAARLKVLQETISGKTPGFV